MSQNRSGTFSRGERRRLAAYILTGLFGAALSFVTVTRLEDGHSLFGPLGTYDVWMIFAGAVGAMAALALSGERLGQPGPAGWRQAAKGMLFVSFVGSLIGGTLALPLYGTMFGPFTLAVTLAGTPLLAVLWFGNLLAVHYLLTEWRRERDSIFTATIPGRGAA